ncbi:MAG: hypothetical protein VB071_05925 [Lawsonibacter sp.]|nr:hypothetical protein [Lawsonibacter sp.]
MDPKNRLLIAFAVIVLIVGAMFTSFGRSLLALNTPSVVLPDVSSGSDGSASSGSPSDSSTYQKVDVTPQTVQSVIATLKRSDSYYRELTVETIWTGGSSPSSVQVWMDGGWSHSRQVLPSGVIRHDLVGADTLYYWYEGAQQYKSTPADELSSDLSQRIPTYETVLALDPDTITSAGYELRGGIPCIYVEVTWERPDRLERYWVSVDSGLLISAELEQEGQLVYRMTAYSSVTIPCPSSASFSLPDGTSLHTVS